MRPGDQQLWSIRVVGASWLNRGPAYWTRRVLFWLMWLAFTVMVCAMVIGLDIGLAHNTNSLVTVLIFSISAVCNLGVFVALLWRAWPSDRRVALWALRNHRPSGRGAGAGASLGLVSIGSGPLTFFMIAPLLFLAAAGILLAYLVLASLPQLPEERIVAYRHAKLLEHYGQG